MFLEKSQILTDDKGSHFTRGSLLTELNVPVHPSLTLYAVIGDWGLVALAGIGLGIPMVIERRQRSKIARNVA